MGGGMKMDHKLAKRLDKMPEKEKAKEMSAMHKAMEKHRPAKKK
jgi:hypothetical protein